MCVDPEEELAPFKQFEFFNKKYEEKCDSDLGDFEVDDRYKRIFNVDKLRLYADNNALYDLTNKYDHFNA